MAKRAKVILHVDMNAFYCSVHAADQPSLYRGKPCAVGGDPERRRGVLVTASYEARKRGVQTGMQVREALQRCPELIFIRPNFDLYREYSQRFLNIVEQYTPLVEQVSIDECFADITGSKLFGTPIHIAKTIQQRIKEECGLPCSVGIGPNKLLAKMASDWKKPQGLTILRLRDVPRMLWPKPCDILHGVGKKTAQKLSSYGIHTVGELANADLDQLKQWFGQQGTVLRQAAWGRGSTHVQPVREQSKSIGHATTLPENISEMDRVKSVFLQLADQVGRRLRRQNLRANGVQIVIREPSMRTITRACKLSAATDDASELYQAGCYLFAKHWPEGKPVRLLGLTATDLKDKAEQPEQLDLFQFESAPKRDQLTSVMDSIRDKYGENALFSAGILSHYPESGEVLNRKRKGSPQEGDP